MFSVLSLVTIFWGLLQVVYCQTVDPSTIPDSTKVTWCTDQKASCPLICYQINATGTPNANDCDPTSLDYSCICSNGISPNASQYSLTIPYFECTAFNNQCVNSCPPSDSACASNCRTAHPCGAQDPVRVNITSTTSTAAATAAATSGGNTGAAASTTDFSGFGGAATATAAAGKSSGQMSSTYNVGQVYGLAMVILSFFVGFTVLL